MGGVPRVQIDNAALPSRSQARVAADYFSEITLSYRSPLTAPPRIDVFTLYTN